MTKLEIILSIAIGQVSTAITLCKRLPKTEKRDRWITALKAASAALTSLTEEED